LHTIKTAYKKLLVHNEISGSQYGNYVAIPESTRLSMVNVGPDCIINNDIEDNLNTVEQDHDYIQSLSRLTPFLDEVTSYNVGFVVKKSKKNKIAFDICHTFLINSIILN